MLGGIWLLVAQAGAAFKVEISLHLAYSLS